MQCGCRSFPVLETHAPRPQQTDLGKVSRAEKGEYGEASHLLSPLFDDFSHSGSAGPVGVMLEEIVQLVGGAAEFLSADVNLSQMQLRVRKVTRVELAGPEQMFLGWSELV